MTKRVILAYSGGLDTTVCLHWLKEKGYKVITLIAQLGQIQYLEPTGEKALDLGAEGVHIVDLRRKFINDYIFPALKAEAQYESGYLLSSALTRPLIAQELIRIANEEGCSIIAHGARLVGNQYVRFENSINTLSPDINLIAPLKELGFKSIKDDLEYAKKHGLPQDRIKYTMYNIEQNLWGANIQLGLVKKTTSEAPTDTYVMTTPVFEAQDKPTTIEIGFKKGEPVSMDGKMIEPLELITLLNKIGGRNAIGRTEIIENTISGEKSHEIYESPAATILYAAHHGLEEIILDKELLHYKKMLSQKLAELVYNGHWFTTLRQGLSNFFEYIQSSTHGGVGISGKVKLNLYRGIITVTGRKAE
jgi:argininosuccinate synthase